MKFSYPISKIEIFPHVDGVEVFIVRQECLSDPETGTRRVLSTWHSPVPVESLKNLEKFLSRDGAKFDSRDKSFLLKRLLPALKLLGISPPPEPDRETLLEGDGSALPPF